MTVVNSKNSNYIVNFFSNKININCPQNIEFVEEWCGKVLDKHDKEYNLNLKITSISLLEYVSENLLISHSVSRAPPVWIGPPSKFFNKNARAGKETKVNTGNILFYKLKDVRVFNFLQFGPVVLTSNNKIIREISTPFYKLLYLLDFDINGLNKIIIESACAINDRFWEPNYAHFLLDQIPRLLGQDAFSKCDKIISLNIINEWQRSLLDYYGISKERLIDLKNENLFNFDEIVISKDFGAKVNHPANKAHPKSIEIIRNSISQNESRLEKKVMIIMRKGGREITNVSRLCEVFVERGYVVSLIDCAKISVIDQIDFFSNASIVIGAHGAALANSVFMKKQSLLFELLPDSYANPSFWIVSSTNQVNYFGVTDISEVNAHVRPRYRNFILNDSAMEKMVSLCDEYM